jgi:hypothetical protein
MFGSIFSGEAEGAGVGDGEVAGICMPGMLFMSIFCGDGLGDGDGLDAGVGVGDGEGMGIPFISMPGILPMSSYLGLTGCFFFCCGFGVGLGLPIPGMLDMS